MTDFDGLLPPRTTPPPIPERATPQAIVRDARRRRTTKAARLVSSGSALSLALAGVMSLRPDPDRHGISPSGPTPHPSASATPAATTTPVRGVKSGPASPVAPPSGTPAATPDGTRPPVRTEARPATTTGRPTPPTTTPSARPGIRYTDIDLGFVPDRPTENCSVSTDTAHPEAIVCTRHLGPESVPRGQRADFAYEACARGRDVTLTVPGDQEAHFWFMPVNEDYEVWRAIARPTGVGPHEIHVPSGSCARFTFHWDGLDNNGQPLPPGDYYGIGSLAGDRQSAGGSSRMVFRVT